MLELYIKKKKFADKVIFDETKFIMNSDCNISLLIGPSGVGKTTLINIISQYDTDYEGKLDSSFSNIEVVFQKNNLLDDFTVYENLYFALNNIEDKGKIEVYLQKFNLEKIRDKKVNILSGGEQKRIALIRALCNDTDLLILDEPTANLDFDSINILIEMIKELSQVVPILIITHDMLLMNITEQKYSINNKKIEHIHVISNKSHKNIDKNRNKKHDLIKLTTANFRNKINKILFGNMLFLIIIICFIFVNVFLLSSIKGINNIIYNGIAENVIYVDLQNLSDYDLAAIENPSDNGQTAVFDEKTIQEIEKINHVEVTIPVSFDTAMAVDYNSNSLNMVLTPENASSEIQSMPSFSNFNYQSKFTFLSLSVPYEYTSYMKPIDGFEEVEIIVGDYPKDGTNEILIPDILANQLSLAINESLIGTTIILPTYSTKNEEILYTENEYVISGVYNTEYEKNINEQYKVYTGFNKDSVNVAVANEQDFKDFYASNDVSTNEYYNNRYSSYENYLEAYNYGNSPDEILIVIDDEENVEAVVNELAMILPNVRLVSQYTYKEQYGSTILRSTYTNYIYVYVIFLAITILVVFITQKNIILLRKRDIAILQLMGYEKTEIRKVFLSEMLLTTLCITFIAFLFTSIVALVFKITEIQVLLSIQNIVMVLLFITLINTIVLLVSLGKLKKENILKTLNNN